MNNQQYPDVIQDDENAISLAQVLEFLSESWKKILIGAVIGCVAGVAGWTMLAAYKAETVLINNKIGTDKEGKAEIRAVNFLSWRNLQKNLPILAAQFVDTGKVTEQDLPQLKTMESASWWQKNVVPAYSLSKADTKDLASISKELQDAEGQTILNLTVTTQGGSKERAMARLDAATRFIREGSAYLLLKTQLNDYEAQILSTDSDLQKKITDTEIELKFLRERARNLESLRQRYPANVTAAGQQVVDLKDANAKYLPISTQLVAVNLDIDEKVELLKRMRDKLEQMAVLRQFVAQAIPMADQESNGLKLSEALLKVETDLRAGAKAEDTNAQQILNTVQADIVQIQTRFTKGLESSTAAYVTRPGPLLPAAGGLLGGSVVMVLLLLTRKALAAVKRKVMT